MPIPKPRLTLEQQAEMIDLFTAGYTINDISETHKVKPGVVVNVLRYHGIIVSRTGRPSVLDKWNASDLEDIAERYKSGENTFAIRADFGISYGQLSSILAALGVPNRRLTKEAVLASSERLDQATRMYQEGFTLADIYAETNVGSPQLYVELRRRKIPKRNRANSERWMEILKTWGPMEE
jgi:hypothetical protein